MAGTTPVRIQDKNGRHTTVHKNLGAPVSNSRLGAVGAGAPPRAVSRFAPPSPERLVEMEEESRIRNEAVERNRRELAEYRASEEAKKEGRGYHGWHASPDREDGYSVLDINDAFPGVLKGDGARIYGDPSVSRQENQYVIEMIARAQNDPDLEVTVYRAMPAGSSDGINRHDWVTPVRSYADVHGRSNVDGAYKVVEMKVKASDIFTEGNSLVEWGYDPA